jgi:hypothetical protein
MRRSLGDEQLQMFDLALMREQLLLLSHQLLVLRNNQPA